MLFRSSSLGPAHSQATGLPTENASVIEARARALWTRLVGLMGYFDLEPDRVLDIVLDVFSVHLASHHAFFVALLRCTPWAPITDEDDESNVVEASPDMYRGKRLKEILVLAERVGKKPSRQPPPPPPTPAEDKLEATRTLPQVLGFKFLYYQVSSNTLYLRHLTLTAKQKPTTTQETPRSLYLVAALLLREGFFTFEDILPYVRIFTSNTPMRHLLTHRSCRLLRTTRWMAHTRNTLHP